MPERKHRIPVGPPYLRHYFTQQACGNLRRALSELIQAGAPQAAAKVRRALKSAEGAERHAYGRVIRSRR